MFSVVLAWEPSRLDMFFVASSYRNKGLVMVVRLVFDWVWKKAGDCYGFALLCFWTGPGICATFSTNEIKLRSIMSYLLEFSYTWHCLDVFTLSSKWLLVVFSHHLIGFCDHFGFVSMTLSWKVFYQPFGYNLPQHVFWMFSSKKYSILFHHCLQFFYLSVASKLRVIVLLLKPCIVSNM